MMGNPIKLCSISQSSTATPTSTSSTNDHDEMMMINSDNVMASTNSNMNIKTIRSSLNKIHLNESSNINLINLDDDDDDDDDDIENKQSNTNPPPIIMDNIIGKTWTDLNFDQLLSDDAQIDDNLFCNKSIASDCTKLPIEDVDLFGRGPDYEPLLTVKCKACNRLIKASAFRRHTEIRHPHMVPRVTSINDNNNEDSNLINGYSQFSLSANNDTTTTNNVIFHNNNENSIKNGHLTPQSNVSMVTTTTTTNVTSTKSRNTVNKTIQMNGSTGVLHNGKTHSNHTKINE
ncbi:Ataxin-7-like protein 1 [Dermatophagoides farinae]|uniref:Ataxin-7-like protein 1 n=1 Tax=Dermatophagoides farinae TaxID=6954 RepID=A0A922HV34_DERFA|nr:Ataxin-7-like protein 1 [Dermatophagoides farinae]